MSLEINKEDQQINDMNTISPSMTFKRSIAGILTTLMLFSGSILGAQEAKATELPEDSPSYSQSVDDLDPNTVIEIPDIYKYTVYSACGKKEGQDITIGDLNSIHKDFLGLHVSDNSPLDWLNYCRGIDSLSIAINTEDISAFQGIKSLESVRRLDLITSGTLDFTRKDFAFLKNSNNLTEVSLYGFNIEPGFIEELTNLRKLSLMTDGNYKIDFAKLTFLDNLDFAHDEPYDVAIELTGKEYDTLVKNGVKITFGTKKELATYLQINKKLDNIVASLEVNENSSDQEKLDAILIYVLDNLTYDEQVKEAVQTDTECRDLSASFYYGGRLYGALEKDTAICGNYAALVQALSERLDLNSYYLRSDHHAWNLITIEGDKYYVDATWLDETPVLLEKDVPGYSEDGRYYTGIELTMTTAQEAIKIGDTDTLQWYMEDPTNYPETIGVEDYHVVINLPSFIKLEPITEIYEMPTEEILSATETLPTEETLPAEEKVITPIQSETPKQEQTEPVQISEDDKYEVKIGDKKWIIGGAVAVGLLAGFGGAICHSNKKKKEAERRRRQMQQYMELYGADNYYQPYGFNDSNNPYDSFYNGNNTGRKSGRRGH